MAANSFFVGRSPHTIRVKGAVPVQAIEVEVALDDLLLAVAALNPNGHFAGVKVQSGILTSMQVMARQLLVDLNLQNRIKRSGRGWKWENLRFRSEQQPSPHMVPMFLKYTLSVARSDGVKANARFDVGVTTDMYDQMMGIFSSAEMKAVRELTEWEIDQFARFFAKQYESLYQWTYQGISP